MRHYRPERLRPPSGPTGSGHPPLSLGRGKAPRQRSRQPGHAVRRPIQLSSTPPTPPLSHAPRRSRGAGLVRDVGDAGVSFPARLCAAGAPTPDAPSRTGSRCAGRCAAWGMGSFCECRWDGAARVVGAQIKPPTAVASVPRCLRERPQLSALGALVATLWAHSVPVSVASPRPKPSFFGVPLSLDSFPASALRVLASDGERRDWPELCRPRRERVNGLTFRDEGGSSPDETSTSKIDACTATHINPQYART